MIRVESLRKSYGAIIAVDGVSLEINQGETFGLLGPNGAGKTTTIHLITGALKPDAGRVTIEGESDPTNPQTRRLLGVAPQAEALYDEMSGEENLRFFGRLYDLAGKTLADRVNWALELAELSDRRRDRVFSLGGAGGSRSVFCGVTPSRFGRAISGVLDALRSPSARHGALVRCVERARDPSRPQGSPHSRAGPPAARRHRPQIAFDPVAET